MKVQIFLALLLALTVSKLHHKHVTIRSAQRADFPAADLDALIRSSGQNRQIVFRTTQSLANGQAQASASAVRSIDSVFSRLPSSSQLDELIISADSVAILKTVQTLATDDSIPCSQIVDYLLQLIGRVRTAIENKQFSANQLQVIIDGALEEIGRLEDEIQRLEDENKALLLNLLRNKLDKLVKELEGTYQKFNAVESQIAPNEARIAGFESEIVILTKENDAERNRIANDNLRLTEIEALINDLENQIKAANNRKHALKNSVAKSEAVIKQNDEAIDDARDKIESLEKQIGALRDMADSVRRKSTDLEIQVERLRTDITIAETKERRNNNRIDDLNSRINGEQQKLANDDLDDLNIMIKKLKSLLPGVQRQIDRQYYYCYGEGAVTVQQTGGVVVYIVRGESFDNYIHNAYGPQVDAGHLAKDDVQLHKVSIFSPTFIDKFGQPAVVHRDSFDGDFTCTHHAGLVSGSGHILEVASDKLVVRFETGEDVDLHLAACSRIESSHKLPQHGQSIAFKAIPSAAGGYNLIHATCY